MTAEKMTLIRLLRLAVAETGEEQAARDALADAASFDWESIEAFAGRNYLSALMYHAIEKLPDVPPEAAARFREAYLRMYARQVQQQYWLDRVEALLQSQGIRYGLLKGGVLQNDYPAPHLRFKSDMDFYIPTEDRPAIRALLEANGATYTGTSSGDEQFTFSEAVGMEFHGCLLYRKNGTAIEGYPAQSFLDGAAGRLTEEGFALNLIGHAVGDLAKGGPGIRYILDLWIYRNRHTPQPDWDAVFSRLQQDGIYDAAKNLLELSEYLFGEGKATPLLEELADYVMDGGLYGDSRRAQAAEAARAGGKGRAALHQVFRSRSEFENRYPWLKKAPFLLPVAWVMRLFQSLKTHRKALRRWRRGMQTISAEEVRAQKQRLERFGL